MDHSPAIPTTNASDIGIPFVPYLLTVSIPLQFIVAIYLKLYQGGRP